MLQALYLIVHKKKMVCFTRIIIYLPSLLQFSGLLSIFYFKPSLTSQWIWCRYPPTLSIVLPQTSTQFPFSYLQGKKARLQWRLENYQKSLLIFSESQTFTLYVKTWCENNLVYFLIKIVQASLVLLCKQWKSEKLPAW